MAAPWELTEEEEQARLEHVKKMLKVPTLCGDGLDEEGDQGRGLWLR